jgi:hypothetical protein
MNLPQPDSGPDSNINSPYCTFHSAVNDTAVPFAVESDFLTKTVCRIIREDIRKKLFYYPREFEAIFDKALTCVSGTQGKLFVEKKTKVENLVSGNF